MSIGDNMISEKEKKELAWKIYSRYSFVLMENNENFKKLYKCFKLDIWNSLGLQWEKDITLFDNDIQDIWEYVIMNFVKDKDYNEEKKERKSLLQDAYLCLHKIDNEQLRDIIYQNLLRDIEHNELDNYHGIKQSELAIGYDEQKTNDLINAYKDIEENKKSIKNDIDSLSPTTIYKIMKIIKDEND